MFSVDFIPFETGKTLEAHLQNCPRLGFRKSEIIAEGAVGFLGIGRSLDDGNDGVDVGQGNDQPVQDMGAICGLSQVEAGPSDDYLLPKIDKAPEDLPGMASK